MSETVLIVDDSLTVRMDLLEALEAAGYRAVACATGAEARAALAREPVGLMILDVLLPDADGIEFLKETRSRAPTFGLPVLMLSTEAEVKDRIRGLQTGAAEYVGKPYDTGYVIARIGELLRQQEAVSPPHQATILVIDDSATARAELCHALENAGYAVAAAASGEEGLRIAGAGRPLAIIVDGVLPGIDGATVIRKVRMDAALRDTPCVLLTAADDRGAELRALDAGADAFGRKEEDLDVTLARLAAVLRSAAAPSRIDTVSLLGPKKILAVDDSMTYLHELASVLRGEGYDVVLARSGEEGLEMLAVQPVDCILLDLLMPGMGGQETCRRIKSSPVVRDIPLIMLTALENRSAMIDGLGSGADDYIPKSSEFEVLKARVRAQIRRKQFEDENRRIREELLRKELEASEARAARTLAEMQAALVEELEHKNRELEAFSYSVSHDLRAPLRAIDCFSKLLLDGYSEKLDAKGQQYLGHVRAGADRMRKLINDFLELSRVGRAELRRTGIDLSSIAHAVIDELRKGHPERSVLCKIQDGLLAEADGGLMRVVLDNLLGNAWKFTAKSSAAEIAFGAEPGADGLAYFVRDNGAGFNMDHASKLFRPFQRLHNESDFPGTGIGLATVQRIIDRHGGRVRAQSKIGHGATFFFTLPAPQAARTKEGARVPDVDAAEQS